MSGLAYRTFPGNSPNIGDKVILFGDTRMGVFVMTDELLGSLLKLVEVGRVTAWLPFEEVKEYLDADRIWEDWKLSKR